MKISRKVEKNPAINEKIQQSHSLDLILLGISLFFYAFQQSLQPF